MLRVQEPNYLSFNTHREYQFCVFHGSVGCVCWERVVAQNYKKSILGVTKHYLIRENDTSRSEIAYTTHSC